MAAVARRSCFQVRPRVYLVYSGSEGSGVGNGVCMVGVFLVGRVVLQNIAGFPLRCVLNLISSF